MWDCGGAGRDGVGRGGAGRGGAGRGDASGNACYCSVRDDWVWDCGGIGRGDASGEEMLMHLAEASGCQCFCCWC